MARTDKRINVLVPTQRKAQYQELADHLSIPLSTLGGILMSVGFDAFLDGADTLAAQQQRLSKISSGSKKKR